MHIPPNKMSCFHQADIWISLVEVIPLTTKNILGDAKGAFTHALSLAYNCDDYYSKVKDELSKQDLAIFVLEDVKLLKQYILEEGASLEILSLAEEVKSTNTVRFTVFYSYNDSELNS